MMGRGQATPKQGERDGTYSSTRHLMHAANVVYMYMGVCTCMYLDVALQ